MSRRSEVTRKCKVSKYLHRVVYVFAYLALIVYCTPCSRNNPFRSFIPVVVGACSTRATTRDRSKTGRGS